MDGATAIPAGSPLQASVGALSLPRDAAPPPDLLEVIDLQDGGFVPGALAWIEGGAVEFRPDAPWVPERDYLWVLRQPRPRARQPVVEPDPAALGEATFSTRPEVVLLDGAWDGDALCLLLSAPIDVDRLAEVTVGEEALEGARWTPADPPLPEGADPDGLGPPGAACLQGDFDAALGQTVRWAGEGSFVLEAGDLAERLEARLRWRSP